MAPTPARAVRTRRLIALGSIAVAATLFVAGCSARPGERLRPGESPTEAVGPAGQPDAESDPDVALEPPPPVRLPDGRVIAPKGGSATPQAARSAIEFQAGPVATSATPPIQEVIDAYLATETATSGTGVSVAVVRPSAQDPGVPTISTYVAGTLGASTSGAAPASVTSSTLFEIGSETKTYTGALLADLVAAGKVSLDDPLSKFAPPGITMPTYNGTPITIGNLATHQSGLPRVPANLANTPEAKSEYTQSMMWQQLSTTKLLWQPGTNWLYSNFGFGVLGTVLANVAQGVPPDSPANPPFAQSVAGVLTGPAGMPSTAIENCSVNTCPQMPGLAAPYLRGNKPAPYWNNTGALAGAGGLVSNGNDMGTWVADALGYPSAIASFAKQPVTQISTVTEICKTPTKCSKPAGEFQMGMSWQLYPKAGWAGAVGPIAFKNGGTAGMHSSTFLLPERRIAVTVMTNSVNPVAVNNLAKQVLIAVVDAS